MVYDDSYNYIKAEQERANRDLILKIHNKFPNLNAIELAERTGISIEFIKSILPATTSKATEKKGGRPAGLIKDDDMEQAYWSLIVKHPGNLRIVHAWTTQNSEDKDVKTKIFDEAIGEKKLTFEIVARGLAEAGYNWADLYEAAYGVAPAFAPAPDGLCADLNNLPPDAVQKLQDIADTLGSDARFYMGDEEAAELDTPTRRVLFVASRTLRHSELRKAVPSAKKALADGHRRTSIATRELPEAAKAVGASLYWVLGSGPAPVSLNSVGAEKLLSAYYLMSLQARDIFRACVRQMRIRNE